MRVHALIAALFAAATAAGVATAQPKGDAPAPQNGAACPPDVAGEAPTIGRGDSKPLSDQLAQSKGVICPPAGVDREIQVTPPAGGRLKVVPPPGAPGGDPSVQPK